MTEMKKFHTKVYCKRCNNDTNHYVLAKHKTAGDHDEIGFSWSEDFIIGECMGCETVNFIKDYDDVTMHFHVPEEGEIHLLDIQVYPPKPLTNASNQSKYELKNFIHLPELLETLYKQVVANFELKYYLLAAAGLRMIIEGICNDLGINDGYITDDQTGEILVDKNQKQKRSNNLNGKINGLVEKSLLTEGQTVILHIIRKLGNQTVHKLNNPSRKVMFSGLEIIENTFNNIYELKKYDSLVKQLKK